MSNKTARLGKQSRKVTSEVQEMGAIASDSAQGMLGQFRENAVEYYEQSRDRVHQADRDVEQFIRDRPLKSVLIAAGVGLLLGAFWTRR
jgi:ElaB/YqjD/DUF883 family membrane-anchored ribosome-binding protein